MPHKYGMDIRDSIDLVEAASPVLYHYTSLYNALDILKSGRFDLSIGNAKADQFQPEGHFYFLSTARTLTGAFHGAAIQGAVFNLGGNWLNQRYRAKPVDYWGARQSHSEAEDRIFSRTDTMSIEPVTAIHVLADSAYFTGDGSVNFDVDGAYDHIKIIERIQKAAESRHVPFFLYNNKRMWMLQAEKGRIKGMFRRYQYDLLSLLEILEKDSIEALSDHARRLYQTIQSPYYQDEVAKSFDVDIHNGKKREDRGIIVRVYNFMRDHKIASVLKLVEFAATKFSPR